MRNPVLKVGLWLAVALAGLAMIEIGVRLYDGGRPDWRSVALIALGFTLAPVGLVYTGVSTFHARGALKLRSGIGVIARWSVPAELWRRFAPRDARTLGRDLERSSVAVNREGDGPIEVVVGERGAIVGERYHWLSPGGIPQLTEVGFGHPDVAVQYLEFRLLYRQKNMVRVPAALRIPFPPSERDEALRVFHHFNALVGGRS